MWMAISGRIDAVKGTKRVWFETISTKPGGAAFTEALTEYDCANKAERTLQTTQYSASGDGLTLDVPKDPTWSYPPPNTVSGDVMAFACGETTDMKGKGTYPSLKAMREAILKEETAAKK